MKRVILAFVFLCAMSVVIVSCRESQKEGETQETSEVQEDVNSNTADEAVKEASKIEKEAEKAIKEAEQAVEKVGEEVDNSLDKAVNESDKEAKTDGQQQS